ncbi:MAG: hypothetical protein ACKVXR_07945 [Planctomycetota bacterium]
MITSPLLILALHICAPQDAPPVELRGAWIATEDVLSRKDLAGAMQQVAESGVNVVFPPASDRELLAGVLLEAHRQGLEVLPWFDPGDAAEDVFVQTVIEACQAHDLDGVVCLKPLARLRKEIAALDPELAVLAPAGVDVGSEDVALQLPKVSSAVPKKAGHVLFGLTKLLEKEGELVLSLRAGPFAEDARLPWRKDRTRRRPASPIEPFAGGGVWTWMTPEGAPRFLAMDGGETGHVTWTFEPEDPGNYSLYAWIPSRGDLAARSKYQIASAGGMRTIGIDTESPRNRGWVFLGESRLAAGKPIEVARLDAQEQDATKITAAGPLMVLRSHRPKPR